MQIQYRYFGGITVIISENENEPKVNELKGSPLCSKCTFRAFIASSLAMSRIEQPIFISYSI